MGPDYVLEEEYEKIRQYEIEEIAENAAIISLRNKVSLEEAVQQAILLKREQNEAIETQSQEVIAVDDYIEFLTPELQDPDKNGLNEQQIYVLKNKILESGLIDY